MTGWLLARLTIVAAFLFGGVFGSARPLSTGYPLYQVALAVFAFGIVGMLFVVGIQAFNSRSAQIWRYPSWARNPFTMREPLQFFHLGGYLMLASGMGGLLRFAYDRTTPVTEAVILASWGVGVLFGVRSCTLVFRHKMERPNKSLEHSRDR